MAEYYPLLARAVAGLGTSTPEVRRGIYERARKALLGQLKSIEPAVPEEDIERESRALDAAVEKLEAELAAKESTKPAPAMAPSAPNRLSASSPTARPMAPRPPLAPRPPRPLEPKKDDALANGAAPPASPRPPVASSSVSSRPVGAAGAAALARPAPNLAREAPARTATALPERRTPPLSQTEASLARGPAVEAKAQPAQAVPASAPEPVRPVTVPPPPPPVAQPAPTAKEVTPRQAPTLRDNLREFSRPRDALASDFESVLRAQDTTSPPILPSARGEPIRPIAQRPIETETRSLRHWIVGTVVLVVVAVVAIMAFILRDNPADLVKRAQPAASADATDQGPGKIVARIEVGGSPAVNAAPPQTAQPTAVPAPAAATTPAAAAAPVAAPAAAAAPVPAATPVAAPVAASAPVAVAPAATAASAPAAAAAPAGAPAVQPAATPAAATSAPTNPAIPVAQRAALVVDAPNPQQKVQTYIGTVVWRLENVAKGAGQPLGVALRADIDIPDAKIKASMELEKNTDATLPASHTIELTFVFAPGSPVPTVLRIDTPYMRSEDQPQGDPLSGAAQQVVPNDFLVALTQGDPTVKRNLDLITSRGWMDVTMLLADGRLAKLTFEKGTSGDQALQEALAAWQK